MYEEILTFSVMNGWHLRRWNLKNVMEKWNSRKRWHSMGSGPDRFFFCFNPSGAPWVIFRFFDRDWFAFLWMGLKSFIMSKMPCYYDGLIWYKVWVFFFKLCGLLLAFVWMSKKIERSMRPNKHTCHVRVMQNFEMARIDDWMGTERWAPLCMFWAKNWTLWLCLCVFTYQAWLCFHFFRV